MTFQYSHTCPVCNETHHPGFEPKKPKMRPITAKHARTLYKLLLAVRYYGRNRIHIRREMFAAAGQPFCLTLDEHNNMTFLRYSGLAVHADRGNKRSGYWLLTRRGAEFLRGYLAIPKEVEVLDGHPTGKYSYKTVRLRDLSFNEPWYAHMPKFDVDRPEGKDAPAVEPVRQQQLT